MWSLCVCVAALWGCARAGAGPPHIVMFIADDLGWSDVGYHGSNAIRTPNLDALAYSGVPLQRHYVTPLCTPSRAALMTGKYPIHTGMQHGVIYGAEPRGLPLSEKILPQYLKELGYSTHLVGKWHLGSYKKEYLPLYRGFDSHTGFWSGKIDMYDHTNMEKGSWGFDFRRGFEVAHDLFGKYATDIYTNEAVKIINRHNSSTPLFLVVAHSAVHSGNPGEPLRAPDAAVDKFSHVHNYQRRKFAAMLSKMDESVGAVVSALQARGLLGDSLVVFSSDNGGAAAGFNDNAASNYPLKGVKNTVWEGGVRSAALAWGPRLRRRAAAQRMHLVDWLPTLLAAAGEREESLLDIDGVNQWEMLSQGSGEGRSALLHNIDDIWGIAAITVDQWKLHVGSTYNGSWDNWYGPGEREGEYDIDAVFASPAALAIAKLDLMPTKEEALEMRKQITLKCDENIPKTPCNPLLAPCLFNIDEDPCEYNNLAEKEPGILQRMLSEMDRINMTAVPPNNEELDAKGDPKYWGRIYTNFGDYKNMY